MSDFLVHTPTTRPCVRCLFKTFCNLISGGRHTYTWHRRDFNRLPPARGANDACSPPGQTMTVHRSIAPLTFRQRFGLKSFFHTLIQFFSIVFNDSPLVLGPNICLSGRGIWASEKGFVSGFNISSVRIVKKWTGGVSNTASKPRTWEVGGGHNGGDQRNWGGLNPPQPPPSIRTLNISDVFIMVV